MLAIWEYIADDDSESSADRVIARIYDECQKLGEMPGMGHERKSLLDERHKFWRVWSYLIVYRWQVTPIQVIAVVHGARDWMRSLAVDNLDTWEIHANYLVCSKSYSVFLRFAVPPA